MTADTQEKPARPAAGPQIRRALRRVPIDRIDRDPAQPRKHFDQDKLEELARSMTRLGLLQPISVRYMPASRRYTIVMGERRWRAAKLAGIGELDCVVLHGIPDGDVAALARAIAENTSRADMTPMEEADAFKRLMDAGYSIDQIADMCGKSAWTVEMRLGLLDMILPMQEALAKGILPVGIAWYAMKLSADNQSAFLARWARGEFRTNADAEEFARACRAAEDKQAEQGGFFVLADRTEEIRAIAGGPRIEQDGLFGGGAGGADRETAAARRALTAKIDRLGSAGMILSDLAAMDPEEVAVLLAGAPGGIGGYRDRLDHLAGVLAKATKTLRSAQAIAAVQAAAVQVDPDLTAA